MRKSKGDIKDDKHWTESDINNFRYYVSADFVDQLQAAFESLGISQRSFAKMLRVSEGRISQVFNDPGNLTLDTMIKWSRAAGMKTGVVLYHDKDSKNIKGPLSGSIFVDCWKRVGMPTEALSVHCDEPSQYQAHYENPVLKVTEKAACEVQAALVNGSSVKIYLGRGSLPKQYSNDLNYYDDCCLQ